MVAHAFIVGFISGALAGIMFGGFYVYERAAKEGYDEAWKVAYQTIQQFIDERNRAEKA